MTPESRLLPLLRLQSEKRAEIEHQTSLKKRQLCQRFPFVFNLEVINSSTPSALLPHPILLIFAILRQSQPFAADFITQFFQFLSLSGNLRGGDLLFEENFALGQLGLVALVDIRELFFLRGGQFRDRGGFFFGGIQPFHRKFIGAFHSDKQNNPWQWTQVCGFWV